MVSHHLRGLEVRQEVEREQVEPEGSLGRRKTSRGESLCHVTGDQMGFQPPQQMLAWRVIHQS